MKELKNSPSLKIVRKLNVKPEIVFDAFTKPDAMRVWWSEDTMFDIDLRAGGTWRITRKEDDITYEMTGKYLEVERPIRLRHTISMPQFSPNSDLISIEIKPVNSGSIPTFVQTGEDIAAELRALLPGRISESEKGWQQGFDLMTAAWLKQQEKH